MRKSFSAFALLIVLSCPTFAGDMLTPPIVNPTAVETVTEGENPDSSTGDEAVTEDISLQLTLTLVEGLLAII